MSRYETVLEGQRHRVTSDMSPEDIERLAEPLVRLNHKEAAIAAAYKVCSCGAHYTEEQWANMEPVPGRKWTLDAHVMGEWRECQACGGALAVFERHGRQHPAETMPFKAVADSYHCCGWCMGTIKPGHIYVERLEKRNGMRALGRWAFCSTECEEA